LIDHGIDIYAKDTFKDNCLHLASRYCHKEIIEQLLKEHNLRQKKLEIKLLELKEARLKKELDPNESTEILDKFIEENEKYLEVVAGKFVNSNEKTNKQTPLHICKTFLYFLDSKGLMLKFIFYQKHLFMEILKFVKYLFKMVPIKN
jgi:ankyrin repeat protein